MFVNLCLIVDKNARNYETYCAYIKCKRKKNILTSNFICFILSGLLSFSKNQFNENTVEL